MVYRTLLVDCTDERCLEERLHAARSLAARFEAVLVGMHVVPPFLAPDAWKVGWAVYIPPEIAEAQRKAHLEARDRARAVFDRIGGGEVPVVWRAAEDSAGWPLAQAARASDLVVVTGGPSSRWSSKS